MLERRAVFVAVVVMLGAPGLAGAQGLRRSPGNNLPFGFFRFPPDAGTGPYLTNVDPGNGLRDSPRFLIESSILFVRLDEITRESLRLQTLSPWDDEYDLAVQNLQSDVDKLAGAPPYPSWLDQGGRDTVGKALQAVQSLLSGDRYPDLAGLADVLHSARMDCSRAMESSAIHHAHLLFSTPGGADLDSLKFGAFLVPNSASYQFTSINYSPGEEPLGGTGDTRIAIFATGTALVPFASGLSDGTGRVGAGLAIGHPDRCLVGASLSSYISPRGCDAEVTASARVAGKGPGDAETLSRRLLDHVRAGEYWLGVGVRSLWDFDSSGGASPAPPTLTRVQLNGTAYLASLTYAFKGRGSGPGPTRLTTLAVSNTYCASIPGLNEVGLEFRTPLWGASMKENPCYVSVRFGTRRDATIAIDTRL